jgi:hypothetical protein
MDLCGGQTRRWGIRLDGGRLFHFCPLPVAPGCRRFPLFGLLALLQ